MGLAKEVDRDAGAADLERDGVLRLAELHGKALGFRKIPGLMARDRAGQDLLDVGRWIGHGDTIYRRVG